MENGSYLIPDPATLDGDSNQSDRLVLTFRIYLGIKGWEVQVLIESLPKT